MTKKAKYMTCDFCRIIIPRLDIKKVNAKVANKKVTPDILTIYGAFLKNFTNRQFNILKKINKYNKFSNEIIKPIGFGASINKGRNQNVKNLKGSE